MALVNRSFSVNVTPGMMPPIVHVSEYDVGRAYTVSILDEQGNTFTIPSGTTASIEGTLNGSVGFTQSATISNNQVSFTLSESMTAYSGKAWCKIKLTQNSQPIQTCAFTLAVDRAGVEAETVIGAPGFAEQINEGVAEYFNNDPPFFELPENGQSGQALLSNGNDSAYWGEAGIPDAVKTALLACFQNVAWVNENGAVFYQNLADALNEEPDIPVPPPSVIVEDGVYMPVSVLRGKTFDSGTGEVIDASQYSAITEEYIPIGSNELISYFNAPSKINKINWTIIQYDSAKNFLRSFVVNQTSGTNTGTIKTFVTGAAYVRFYWYNPDNSSFVANFGFANNPTELPVESGDVSVSTGENTVSTPRIRTVGYIPAVSNITVTGCPFGESWNTWSQSGGYGIRCFDNSKNYIGYLNPQASSGLFGSDISTALLSGTAYVRLIFQKTSSAFPDINKEAKLGIKINGITYYLNGGE